MIGLLVVSHSDALARGVAAMATEMGGADSSITAVGGDPDGGIGTSMLAIRAALADLLAETAGVVVLADLGSAVLNAKHAIDDLGTDEAVIADAPILEGALNAAPLAQSGQATLEAVRRAAEEANHRSKL